MPAVSKGRQSKHAQKPYARKQKKVNQSADDAIVKEAGASGLIESAAKGLFRLVSWVFTSGEDLSKSVGTSASKAIHRSPPQRSLTSQLEDGTLSGTAERSDSMLAPDLIPHYLGKTPMIVKARREGPSMQAAPKFQIPKFDALQFKIPALPTPISDTRKPNEGEFIPKTALDNAPPPRGRSLKALELSAETLSRHDEEIMLWLSSYNISPEDLADAETIQDFEVPDREKLRKIITDEGFFRRRGLFPPVSGEKPRATSRSGSTNRLPEGQQHEGIERRRRSVSYNSQMSLDKAGSDRSSTTLRGQRIDSRNWQTTSSTGILSAWRDICQRQDSIIQNQALSIDKQVNDSLAGGSIASSQHESLLWHDGVSFTQKNESELQSVPEGGSHAIEASEKYWAPIRSFPMPDGNDKNRSERRSIAATVAADTTHRRRHSRHASLVRRPRQTTDQAPHRTPRDSRQQTPVSAVSSHRSTSRRPVNAGREPDKMSRASVEPEARSVKPTMVDSQVQTTDELMSFLMEVPNSLPDTPTISKDRRKRPGCFSALDEDMEDLFGPYSDVPLKKSRVEDDDEVLSRPRVTLLRENEDVKKLRAQQRDERASMPPPTTVEPTVEKSSRSSTVPVSDEISNDKVVSEVTPLAPVPDNAGNEAAKSSSMFEPAFGKKQNTDSFGALASSTFSANRPTPDLEKTSKAATFSFGKLADNASSGLTAKSETENPQSFPSFDFGHTPSLAEDTAPKSAKVNTEAPKFTFGATAKPRVEKVTEPRSEASSATSKPFTFGSTTDSANTKADGLGSELSADPKPFSFGKPTDAISSSAGKEPGALAPTIGFGGFSNGSGASGFNFGTAAKVKNDAIPSLETASKDRTAGDTAIEKHDASVPQFSFGGSSNEPTKDGMQKESNETLTESSPFSFAQASKSAAPATFSFGISSKIEEPKASFAGSSFKFGTSTDVQASQVDQPSTQPSFSFGSAKTDLVQNQNGTTSTFGFGNPKNDVIQIDSNQSNTAQQPSGGFNFGASTTPTLGSAPGFGTAPPKTENKAPAFSFGTSSASIENKPAQFSFGEPTANTRSNAASPAPIFGGTSNQANSTQSIFGSMAPVANAAPAFSFGQAASPAPATNMFAAGSASATQPNPTSSGTFGSFGNPPVQSASAMFGTSQAAATPSFSFGANAPGSNSGFSFGASNTAANPPTPSNAFTFGQAAAPPPTQPASSGSFQFGAQPTAQAGAQPFSFGQPQSAPGTGFASPAAVSPSIQSATAPGSPNPFNFSAAPGAAPGSGAGGARKIMQPRSRRPRPGAGR